MEVIAETFGVVDPDVRNDHVLRVSELVDILHRIRRDRLVLARCREHHLPVTITMAGGYARRVDDTVAIHACSVRVASEFARRVSDAVRPDGTA